MDPTLGTLIGGIAIAVITFLGSPWITARLAARQANDPVMGWKAAFEDLKQRADRQEKRIEALETEVNRLEDENATKTAVIVRQEYVMRQQGRMIVARDSRISQLEQVFRAGGGIAPPPDPSVHYWLTLTPPEGIQTS